MLPEFGGRCSHCRTIIKNKHQNGTLFSEHIYASHLAPRSVSHKIWSKCAALYQSVPRPYEPSAALATASPSTATPAIVASTLVGSTVAVLAAASVSRSSALPPSTGPMHQFLDLVSEEQESAIESAILKNLFVNRVPFLVVESPTYLAPLKALRPAYFERNLFPNRKKLAGPALSELYAEVWELLLSLLASWCVRRKAVLIPDAWENVKHHHTVNLLAVVGDKIFFSESVYCWDEGQDAVGQARLVQEKLYQYSGTGSLVALATDNASACVEIWRLVSVAKPALVSLNDQAHVTNPVIGDFCKVPWLQMRLSTATTVPSFLRRKHCLLAS